MENVLKVILAFLFFCNMYHDEVRPARFASFFVRFNLISCRLFTHHFSRVQHFRRRKIIQFSIFTRRHGERN